MDSVSFVFGLMGMSFGVIGFTFALICYTRVEKLTRMLESKGIIEKSTSQE